MVEFGDGKHSSRTNSSTNDGALSGQVFGDAKRDRQRDQRNDKDKPQPHVQPQNDNQPGGRRHIPDFTPPAPRPKDNPNPRIQPADGNPQRNPQRDQTPKVNPRDQFPNFPKVNPGDNRRPEPRSDQRTDQRQRPDQPHPVGPKPGDNAHPQRQRIEFPDLKPNQPGGSDRPNPAVNPRVDDRRVRPDNPNAGPRPDSPFVRPGTDNPGVKPGNNGSHVPRLDNLFVRPRVDNPSVQPRTDIPAVPPIKINPGAQHDGNQGRRTGIPNLGENTLRPGVPRDNSPAVQPAFPRDGNPGVRPQTDNPGVRQDNPAVQQQNDNSSRFDNFPRNNQQRPNIGKNIIGGILQDALLGPQYPRPGQYSPGYPGGYNPGGCNPGFRPQRPTGVNGILNDVVRDLINPGTNCPPGGDQNYDPRLDPRNPNYDPRFDPRNDPRYDPRNDPRFDPRHDPRYDPRHDPRNDPRYDPRFNPGYDPRHQPNPNNAARRIIGDVIGDLLSPRTGPGCNPGGSDQRYYPQDDQYPGTYNPGSYPQDRYPQRDPGGRFSPQNGQIRDFIRQGVGNLRNNPQGFDGLLNGLGGLLGGDTQFNIDRERGELNLAMDFTRAYDSIAQKQGLPPNPEIRRVLGGLDSINLSADTMNLNWKGEQLVSLGDNAQGPGKDFRILLGAGTNRTTFQIQSNETRLNLSGIEGLEAVDPQGRRLRVHMVDLDTSDPAGPKGSITIDNPVPRPAQLPPDAQWPEQVALPIVLNGPEQKQIADALPGMIRTINSTRNAAKTGDLSQLTGNLNPGDLANIIGMLRAPKPQPANPDQYNPEVPPVPQPEWNPQVPPAPEPGIREVPTPPEPGIRPGVQLPPEPGIPAEVPTLPQPTIAPDGETVPPPPAIEQSALPSQPPALEPGAVRLNGPSMLRGSTAALYAPSINRDRTAFPTPVSDQSNVVPKNMVPTNFNHRPLGNVDYLDFAPAPAAKPQDHPISPAAEPVAEQPAAPSVELPVAPPPEAVAPNTVAPPEAVIPNTVTPAAEKPLPGSTTESTAVGRSADLLRARGIKIPQVGKSGPDKLFSLVFADADQSGPMVTGFNKALTTTRFREDASTIGSTLNRFDVDKQRKSITVGLDFAKAYDTVQTDREKYKPETRQFLSNLESVTITPEQIRLKLNGPSKLPMEGEGLKKADLWLGTNNGETTFDIQTTEQSATLKNITGLQAEVSLLGKKLNVYEVNIDTSTGVATATALIDNPFDKPIGVPDSTWSKTMHMPIELGKTSEEIAEVNKRLPQTLKSLNSMRNGAQSGAMAERIGNLTKDEIIGLLKFQQ
ncbi:MAG: hypothetical protein SGJ27_29715 [Candidatus Melainabacteria bacterium]|nr:hypothetical protein [Candidatus Melainabacteria bacterium]